MAHSTTPTVGIIGLGYVGLPLATAFAVRHRLDGGVSGAIPDNVDVL